MKIWTILFCVLGEKKFSGTVEGQERFFARLFIPTSHVDNPDVTRYSSSSRKATFKSYKLFSFVNINIRLGLKVEIFSKLFIIYLAYSYTYSYYLNYLNY